MQETDYPYAPKSLLPLASLRYMVLAEHWNLSEDTAKIDVQGPNARKILLELGFEECAPLKFWNGLRS